MQCMTINKADLSVEFQLDAETTAKITLSHKKTKR